MPYKDADDGQRTTLAEEVMANCRQVFGQGLQLEAILLAIILGLTAYLYRYMRSLA